MTKSVFIFRRDLRLNDNTGLIKALKESDKVIPIFIFTPEQLENNKYKSDNCVQFMMQSLEDLDTDLKKNGSRLFYFFGTPDKVIREIVEKEDIDRVYVNMDYTPYSVERDKKIEKVCDDYHTKFLSVEDILLLPVATTKTGSDTVYTKFTPFFNKAKKEKVREVVRNSRKNYFKKNNKIVGEFKGKKEKFYKKNDNVEIIGGRSNALKILKDVQKWKDYNKKRDVLAYNTTRLSAYIKFGCVSIREVYHVFKKKLGTRNDLIKQLYWRDFYYNIAFAYPYTLDNKAKDMYKRNFKKKYNKVPWITYKKASAKQKKDWYAWVKGLTGFPVVDACMREINKTGFMHNRGRLIVASFLVKNMFWSPFEGEKYFAQTLIDYDPSVNGGGGGNWGWVSGAGTDSQPYFRIFSPNSQSERFDPDCKYIKKWIPELKDVENKHIHDWERYNDLYPKIKYPKPILNYKKSRETAIKKYKKALY